MRERLLFMNRIHRMRILDKYINSDDDDSINIYVGNFSFIIRIDVSRYLQDSFFFNIKKIIVYKQTKTKTNKKFYFVSQ